MPPQLPDTVEHWPLDRLIPYARNARTHSEDQVAQIAASIVEFGWLNPVLVDDAGNVIAGHGRVLAARKLALDSVPVIRASHLTPAQVRAYRLADNRLAELSGWNEEMLAAELVALRDEDVDLSLLGFDDADIDRLLAASSEEAGAADEAPEPPANPISRPGDLWICGEHKILCGDATVLASVDFQPARSFRVPDRP
jgi:ParB-like chromosome segregation protein Spo0J